MGEDRPGCEDPEKLRLCNFACPADGRGAEGTDVVEAWELIFVSSGVGRAVLGAALVAVVWGRELVRWCGCGLRSRSRDDADSDNEADERAPARDSSFSLVASDFSSVGWEPAGLAGARRVL